MKRTVKILVLALLLTPLVSPAVFVSVPVEVIRAALSMVPSFIPSALAAGETFQWNLPTKRQDGSTLPAAEIAKTTIKCGTAKGGPYSTTKDAAAPATTLAADFATGTDGWHYCVATVTGTGTSAGESPNGPELAFFTKAGAVLANPLAPAAPAGFVIK